MTRRAKIPAALLLAVVLAITSVSIAAAGGTMGVAGAMILCPTGAEAATAPPPADLPRDQPAPACWDCTIAALTLPGARALAVPLRPARSARPVPVAPALCAARALRPQARAPPFPV